MVWEDNKPDPRVNLEWMFGSLDRIKTTTKEDLV
jgi:hypothetical protein